MVIGRDNGVDRECWGKGYEGIIGEDQGTKYWGISEEVCGIGGGDIIDGVEIIGVPFSKGGGRGDLIFSKGDCDFGDGGEIHGGYGTLFDSNNWSIMVEVDEAEDEVEDLVSLEALGEDEVIGEYVGDKNVG